MNVDVFDTGPFPFLVPDENMCECLHQKVSHVLFVLDDSEILGKCRVVACRCPSYLRDVSE